MVINGCTCYPAHMWQTISNFQCTCWGGASILNLWFETWSFIPMCRFPLVCAKLFSNLKAHIEGEQNSWKPHPSRKCYTHLICWGKWCWYLLENGNQKKLILSLASVCKTFSNTWCTCWGGVLVLKISKTIQVQNALIIYHKYLNWFSNGFQLDPMADEQYQIDLPTLLYVRWYKDDKVRYWFPWSARTGGIYPGTIH